MRTGTDFRKWVKDQNVEAESGMWPEANLIVEKEGDQVDNLLLSSKSHFLFGSNELNDFKL